MKETIIIVISCAPVLAFGFYVLLVLKRRERIRKEMAQRDIKPYNYKDDDFMCIMLTDGSTITSKNGVTVRVSKLKD